MALYAKKQFAEAQALLERAVALTPEVALLHANLATVLNDAGDLTRAKHHYQQALQINQHNPQAHNGLGIVARKQRNYSLAIAHYRRAIDNEPNFSAAHVNLANALNLSGQFAQGLEHAKTALKLNHKSAEAWNNQGFAENMLGDIDGAKRSFAHAVTLAPDLAIARFNTAAMQLREGNYADGWKNYEWRLRLNNHNVGMNPERLAYPSLDQLDGARITLVTEQGMGDFLQFIRFAKILHGAGGKLTVTCDRRLIPLISHLPWIDQLLPRGTQTEGSDFVIPIMSLGRMLNIEFDNIPTPIPYIRVPAERTEHWAAMMTRGCGEKLVGLTWFGNPNNPVNNLRSIPFSYFQSLSTVSDVRYISLQTGSAVAEVNSPSSALKVADLGIFAAQENLQFSFDDTAAMLLNLDLFITSCTVTAHLAGALGVPTWLLLSKVADWRWGQTEQYSRWYPSIRIFRQPEHADWDSVFREVSTALQALTTE